MPKFYFIEPETVQLPLSEGHWIEVKKYIDYADQRRLAAAGLRAASSPTGQAIITMDLETYEAERLVVWIIDWSLRDKSGKPVPFSREALGSLNPDAIPEIQAALDQHIEGIELEKKARNGKPEPDLKLE